MSREIEQPYRRAATASRQPCARGQHGPSRERCGRRGAAAARVAAVGARTAGTEERGAVFLRADRLEGNGDKTHRGLRQGRAAHAARDRARRLAARTTWSTTRSGPRATSRCARGSTGSAGPSSSSSASARSATSTQPRFYISENGSRTARPRRSASRVPTCTRRREAQYTSCVAPNNDWYLRSDEIEVDKLRKVGTARDATVHFLGVPVMYTPWLEFPLSERAQVRVSSRRRSGRRRFAASSCRRPITSISRRTTTRR